MNEPFAAENEDVSAPPSEEAARQLRLLEELKRGSREAAEELVAATYAQVYGSLCRLTGNPDQAADLTQETYRKAWQSLAGFREASQVSTWLYKIAYNTFLNSRRRPFRIVPLEPAVEATAVDPEPPPDETAERSEERDRLRRAVLALPEELRFAVTAHFWNEIPVAEIARLEGLTPPGIRKRLARAFEAIQAALEGKR
ncbi:MAG: sigma-70 family RNA polymerase sigma factor [Thermoanaerobaculia bacterium]